MTGALMTLLSSTMAKGLPTFSRVASAKRRAPTESNLKLTTGSLVLPKLGCASVSVSPLTMTRRRTTYAAGRSPAGPPARGSSSSPGGTLPRRASSSDAVVSTSWNVILAVLPMSALTCSGSSMPGSSTRMRSAPTRWMVGFLGAGLVDAAAHDLDRLIDRRRALRVELDLAGLDRDRPARAHGKLEAGAYLLHDRAEVVLAAGLAQGQRRHDRLRRRARYSRSSAPRGWCAARRRGC